jgi:2-oxoisovalerate dehydrogenase E1 component
MVREAESVPFPPRETATSHVFKEHTFEEIKEEKTFAVMMDGIHAALRESMEKDPSILVFGEDVARDKGGVFGITRHFTKDFGSRCFNTPLAEATIVGVAVGLSFHGYKPVIEIQFSDYAWPAMSQIVCELASMHYRSNGEWHCPVVLRMTTGGYIQGGPYHSQSIEAVFCHMPGLKVVIPSHPMDAYRLMRMAIEDPNPVIFLEHKALYRQPISYVYPSSFLPLGKAAVVREGKDITLIGYGFMIPMAYEAAELSSKEGISVEIIDLRSVNPIDMETILASVKKTGKVLIVHEAAKNCGLGAELSARIMEEAFCYLDAPVSRLTGKDCPIPYCKDLEEEVLPQKKDILVAIRKLYSF